MSGKTRSTPTISSEGKASPASTRMMSLPQRIAMVFLPISPRPPSGIILRPAGAGPAEPARFGAFPLAGAPLLSAGVGLLGGNFLSSSRGHGDADFQLLDELVDYFLLFAC